MRRIAWAVAAVVLTASAAKADWGAMPTASGMPVSAALGPGYGPPPGMMQPPPPPMEGPHQTLSSYMSAPSEREPARYGLHPSIKHFFSSLCFWKKKSDDCGDCNKGCKPGHGHSFGQNGAMYNGGAGGLNHGPAPQQGTLVFPQHPFVRGPRDYYMWEPR